MLVLISPSKSLDFSNAQIEEKPTTPSLLNHSKTLVKELKKLSKQDIAKLMSISEKLSDLNAKRYQEFSTPFNEENAKQAIKAFKGDVYEGLDANSFKEKDFKTAQEKLRILSGLYGLIRPLDFIQPYRLEMGTKLANPRGKNLYEFWGDRITDEINKVEHDVVINLASNEYFKAVNDNKLKPKLLHVTFKENRDGNYKVIGLLAKKARGMMARYIITNAIESASDLKGFTEGGYKFNQEMSSDQEMVFTR